MLVFAHFKNSFDFFSFLFTTAVLVDRRRRSRQRHRLFSKSRSTQKYNQLAICVECDLQTIELITLFNIVCSSNAEKHTQHKAQHLT